MSTSLNQPDVALRFPPGPNFILRRLGTNDSLVLFFSHLCVNLSRFFECETFFFGAARRIEGKRSKSELREGKSDVIEPAKVSDSG